MSWKALALVAALGACRSAEIVDPTAAAVHGRIEGADAVPKNAAVQVYRVDEEGLPSPDPFETVRVERDGRFGTRVLSPGRYRLVYRGFDGPPSVAVAVVPAETSVVVRPVVQTGLVHLRVRAAEHGDAVRCRLTEIDAPEDVPDVREFKCGPEAPAFLRGLRPGKWALDVPELGATTIVDVPGGVDVRELVVDPPAQELGGTMTGQILRLDGSPAPWLVVAVRQMHLSGDAAVRWGRYGTTDRSGHYKVVGIPPGPALVRVECRQAPIRILPSPQIVAIPPAGTFSLGFTVEP